MSSDSLGFDDDFMATMLGDFLDESQGYLTNLNENLMVLEQLVGALDENEPLQVDLELLNEMFRDAHSLKGLSAMLQLGDVNSLTHKIENVFDAARDQSLGIDRQVVDLMFDAFDRLTGMVERLKDPHASEVEYRSVVDRIQALLESAGAQKHVLTSDELAAAFSTNNEVQSDSLSRSWGAGSETLTANAEPYDPFEGISDEAEIPERYLSIFIGEAEESLDALNEMLLSDDDIDVDPVLVICHRIKGSAASIGLNRTAKLAHLMEDQLQELKDHGCSITSETADALIAAADSLREFIYMLKSGEKGRDTYTAASRCLLRAAADTLAGPSHESASNQDAQQPDSTWLTSDEEQQLLAVVPDSSLGFIGVVEFEVGQPQIELKALLLIQQLKQLGDVYFENADRISSDQRRLLFGLRTSCDEQRLRRYVDLAGVIGVDVRVTGQEALPRFNYHASSSSMAKIVESQEKASLPALQLERTGTEEREVASEEANGSAKGKPAETLRVDIERLDHLMNLAGQLVINKARFGQIAEQLKGIGTRKQSVQRMENVSGVLDRMLIDAEQHLTATTGGTAILQNLQSHVQQIRRDLEVVRSDIDYLTQARSSVNDLGEAVHQLERVADSIQKCVMDTRMVPIGPLFGRFKRVIRDVTRINGKEVHLAIRGDKTELDKRMIDELGDPLIHMVRNSADHGIESPEDRLAAGKPRQGTVTLDAFHRGNRIYVQVKDDGKGLDPELLRCKAIEKGIITPQDAERLTAQQSLQLIWEPGFSTAGQITEVSGRGMGMDIVRSKIEQLNGTIELESEVGKGTTITIKLPLTMAILPSLLTVIANDVFAIPMESVSEIVRVSPKDMATVHGMQTASVRGRVISVVELSKVLHWNRAHATESENDKDLTLVIIGTDVDELGLVVDGLLGEEDIVIKSLAENYRNVPGVAGASILGDGRVSLILDVAALIDIASCRVSSHGTLNNGFQYAAR